MLYPHWPHQIGVKTKRSPLSSFGENAHRAEHPCLVKSTNTYDIFHQFIITRMSAGEEVSELLVNLKKYTPSVAMFINVSVGSIF